MRRSRPWSRPSDTLGTTWTATGFDDAAWAAGTTAVGYEQLATGFDLNEAFDTALGRGLDVDIPPGGVGDSHGHRRRVGDRRYRPVRIWRRTVAGWPRSSFARCRARPPILN